MRQSSGWVIAAVVLLALPGGSEAAVVWSGTPVSFTKLPFANPALPSSQDRLTDAVALSRGDAQGLYNPLSEPAYSGTSPAGTRWAFAGLRGNPEAGFGAGNHASLNFSTWEIALGGRPSLAGNIVERPGVLHLVDEDVYLDITFTDWSIGGGGGGGFSYTRASPAPADGSSGDIPLPLPALVALGALLAFAGSRGLARRTPRSAQADDGPPPSA